MSRTLFARRRAGVLISILAALCVIAPVALAQPDAAQPDPDHLKISSLSSPPADATAGDSFVLQGRVQSSGPDAVSDPVTVHLLRGGQEPIAVGSTAVSAPASGDGTYRVDVSAPAGLPDGSYMVVACAPVPGTEGALDCASAHRRLDVGTPDPVRGPRVVEEMSRIAADEVCSPGARTLSQPGDTVYPEVGNGGYISLHTDVNLVYDAVANEFLGGTHVVLTDRATQCLTDFSLDFARTTPDGQEERNNEVIVFPGADLTVEGVTLTVEGEDVPAIFEFEQPTFPGNPNGPDDPNPLAHQTGQETPVSADNPLPPACAPEGNQPEDNGLPCPARKLVIVPAEPIPAGATFDLKVDYKGTPGVYTDGDGSIEGWFRSNNPVGDGSFVTTEPVGSMAWMPLNNHPTAKPTYDFTHKVTLGREAVSNGELLGSEDNPPDLQFPGGSTTWRWSSPEPIASYLVEASIADFDLTERLGADGVLYYQAQGSSIPAELKATNKAILDTHEAITEFHEDFTGEYPFTTNGVVVGIPPASFQEEMQGKITFNNSRTNVSTLHHENIHQWWGDNVAEGNFNETFYKEGFGRLGNIMEAGLRAANAAGGIDTPAGDAAFEASLVTQFTTLYNTANLFVRPPSNPTPASLFNGNTTYNRTASAYIALRQILGHDNWANVLKRIQSDFRGGSIEQAEVEAAFHRGMPNQTTACHARLKTFFTEWFDTAFPANGSPTAIKPQLTGPGLPASASGTTFFNADGTCNRIAAAPPVTNAAILPEPAADGKVTGPATVALTAKDDAVGVLRTEFKLDGGDFQPYTGPIVVSALGSHTIEYRSANRDGVVEATKNVTFTIVAPPAPTPVCANPGLTAGVSKPLRRSKGVATLRRGKAYRYTGRLTCGGTPAPAGTVVGISSVIGSRTSSQPGVAVGGDGKIDTLLRFSSKRTVVFSFASDGVSAEARVRIAVARR